MKTLLLNIVLLALWPWVAAAQLPDADSLVSVAKKTDSDTIKLIQFGSAARIYAELNPDSAQYYAEQSLTLAKKLQLKLDEGGALREIGYAYLNKGNYPRSLQILLSALTILEDPDAESRVLVGKFSGDEELMGHQASPHAQRLNQISFTHQILGILYANSENYLKSKHHHLLAKQCAEQSGSTPMQSVVNTTFNRVYLNLNKKDSALFCIQQAYDQAMQSGYKRYLGSVLLNMGRTYAALDNIEKANEYYRKAVEVSVKQGYFRGVIAGSLLLADYYTETGKTDSAFQYIKKALATSKNLNAPDVWLRSYTTLARYYSSIGNNDSIVKYQALIIRIKDNLFNTKQAQQFQNIDFEIQQKQQELEAAKTALQNRWRMYTMLIGLAIFLIIVILQWRYSQQRRTANELLSKQKAELELALLNIKTTQRQLIQSEKMASLGELTAGIAHEIQNPLNFVNNFSEVNKELLTEMNDEISKGNMSEVRSIAKNVIDNQEKINQHGKRADAIVKGMLQHSRASNGQKEPTDINALCDEYLRLAYHGIRAKDKSFNAKFETDFDSNIEKVNVIPQDIGRVVLNLINNAFYAVNEKAKTQTTGYKPEVIVVTKNLGNKSEIKIKDNGNGIPESIKEKIFQPFFTTKPTGQGTGLGLSLSYDIMKAHQGEISLRSSDGNGAEFTVVIPNGV
jgi:signal transduction histidine kinase